jgi:hypothetical protein
VFLRDIEKGLRWCNPYQGDGYEHMDCLIQSSHEEVRVNVGSSHMPARQDHPTFDTGPSGFSKLGYQSSFVF